VRQIEEAFAARLAASVTTLCACWRFERVDGALFGATDHDGAITFDGVAYEPASGLESATFDSTAGLAPGRAAASGAISLGFLTEADVDAGLWDGGRVDVWHVDWGAPEHRVMVWSGCLSEITRRGTSFSAELVSLKAGFERSIGRVYARSCDADVGDARCGVDLNDPAFRGEATVSAVLGDDRVLLSGLDDFDADWFAGGRLAWISGANAGGGGYVRRHAGAEIDLVRSPRFAMEVGDRCVVTGGCDKSFAMCGAKFSNRINFRGFPQMPGPEAVLAGPSVGKVNDGGRRG
jgi:uncharacterized phage protein (TIGR02218 family)